MNNCPMGPGCHGLKEQSEKLDAYPGAGHERASRSRRRSSPTTAAQDMLAAPIDEGFNRLAWALPYVVGRHRRRARRPGRRAAGRAATPTPPRHAAAAFRQEDALRARLDDELRDLD